MMKPHLRHGREARERRQDDAETREKFNALLTTQQKIEKAIESVHNCTKEIEKLTKILREEEVKALANQHKKARKRGKKSTSK